MIGRTNTGSGGGGLNFKVVGGNTTPSNPKENMIFINTDVNITSWVFSATEPETPVEGMTWIFTSSSSTVEFNALKKNGIQVYPISAKQYVNGAWVDVTAKSYLNGVWVDWWDGTLYDNGNEYTAITGGWKGANKATASATGTFSKGSKYLASKNASGATYGQTTVNAYDMTGYTILHALIKNSDSVEVEMSVADDFPSSGGTDASTSKTIGTTQSEITLNISAVTGLKKVHIRGKSTSIAVQTYKVWMT